MAPPRHHPPAPPVAPAPLARHGRQRAVHPVATLLKILAGLVAVVAVSAGSLVAIAALDVGTTLKKGVPLVDSKGSTPAPATALSGGFNVLLAGSDSGNGNAAYGERGENLNDVTMLLHVSADHKTASVVSFPRDMFVPIPSCPKQGGGSYSAMSSQKVNSTLTYGGLPCTVLTIEKLTGLSIPYAAVIQFDGVVAMSNAIGGVPVCVAGDIKDPYTGLDVKAGENVLSGQQALAFLRTRHGVGDGSDLGRISNQQVFLSALMRKIKSADTLGNPLKVYALAKAAAANITPSESLSNVGTITGMALALKGVNLANMTFVQYPNHYVSGGVAPTTDAATQLMTALKNDQPISLTGNAGVGSVPAPGATAAPGAGAGAGTGSGAGGSGAGGSGAGGSGAGGATAAATPAPSPSAPGVTLPNDVHGQTASEQTCSKPFQD